MQNSLKYLVRKLSLLLSIAFFLCGCIAESEDKASKTQNTEWTIFIYGHADHNLTPGMVKDFQEMISAKLNSKIKVILAVDLDDSVLSSTVGTGVYEILGGGKSKLIESYPEQNFDDPSVLEFHVKSAFSKYPSKKRGVILWNHGSSWDGGFGGDTQNGTNSSPGGLSIHQIKSVLQSVASQLNLGVKPFDFISFDTCLMGDVQTASELKDLSKYFFASAELDYGDGWDYNSALTIIASLSASSINQLAPLIVSSWNSHHMNKGEMDENLRTQVALDFSKMDSFILQMNNLLANYKNSSLPELGKALKRSSPGYGISSENEALIKPQSYRDVGQFLSLLANSSDASLAADSGALLSFAQEELIKAQSLGDVRSGSQLGLSIESRILSDWTSKKSDYLNLFWDNQTDWSVLLDDLTSASVADNSPPTLSTSIINNTNPTSINKPRVSFSTNNADVDMVQVILKLTSSGVDYSLGLLGFGFVEDQSSYYFDWDGKYLELSNGTTSSLISLALQNAPGLNSEGDTLAVAYKIPGVVTDGTKSLVVDLIGYESPLSTIAVTINGQISTFKISDVAGAGFSFVPYIYKNQVPYFEVMTPIPIGTGVSGLELVEKSAPAGPYKIQTQLSDVWTNTSVDSDNVTVVNPF